jgi:hypothetical protein
MTLMPQSCTSLSAAMASSEVEMRKGKGSDGRRNNRPPRAFQFRPGESGNKKGRPKKIIPSVLALVAAELESKHSIGVGTKQVQLPLRQLLIKQFIRVAMKGNIKALFHALEMLDTIQQSAAKQEAQKRVPHYTMEDLKKMTSQQLSDLYRSTLAEGNREARERDDE